MTDHDSAAVSLREIADAAGVSISSVSRALAGRGDLRRETRARILEVARSMKYDRRASERVPPRRGSTLPFRTAARRLGRTTKAAP